MKNKYKPILILICIINLFLLTAFGQNITKAIGKQSTVTESVYNQEKPKLPIGKNQHLTVTQSVYGIHEETILHLITTVDKFSSLTEEEQLLILTYYQVEQETMILLEEKGFGLLESIEIVVLVKELDFTIEQATRLITKYPKNQEIELVKLLQGFKTFFEEEQSTEEKFQNIKDLFTKGYGVGEIRNAYIMSETVDANPSELVEDIENRKSDIDKKLLFYTIIEDCNEIEMYLVEEMQRWYPVDLEKLVENKEKKNLTWQEIYEKFEQEKKQRIKPAETILSSTNLEGSLNPNEEGNHIQSMMTTFSTDSRGQQYYPKYINPAYNYRQYNNEFINTSTGSVEFETQLFKLPGRNGLDVNINLNYNSNTASIYEMNQYISIWTPEWLQRMGYRPEHPIYYQLLNKYEGYRNYVSSDTYIEKQFNLGVGWSLNLPSIEQYITTRYLPHTDEYGDIIIHEELMDVMLLHLGNGRVYRAFDYSEYNLGYDYYIPRYLLKGLELRKNPGTFSNGQSSSTHALIYKDGKKVYFNSSGKAIGEEDRYGNRIYYYYTNNLLTKIKDTLDREINITYYQNGGEKKVTFKGPDNLNIELTFEYLPQYTLNDENEFVLKKIKDQMNRETIFDYTIASGKFNFSTDPDFLWSEKTNYFANLTKVTYPTGATSSYIYEKNSNGKIGSARTKLEYYRIKTREDKQNGLTYNQETYTYEGDYTQYEDYHTTVKNTENKETRYTFNSENLNTHRTIRKNNILLEDESYSYFKNTLLSSQITKLYDADGTSLTKQKTWQYNDHGDLLRHTNERGQITNYQYENKFHQLTSQEIQIDSTRWRKTEYNINSSNGNVNWTKQHNIDNGVDKSITTYFTYDQYGNPITKKIQKPDGTFIEESYEYSSIYRSGYLTKKTSKYKDYQGNQQTAVENMTYDFNTGRLLTLTDGNLNTTAFQYDNIGRVTQVSNPDNSKILIAFDDIQNIVTATLENNHQVRNLYDGLGRLIKKQETKNGQWLTLEENHYDTLSRIDWTKDAKGNMTKFEYDLFNRVTKIINPDISKKQIQYKDKENKRIEINEEGAQHLFQYDNVGNLIMEEVKPNSNTIYRNHYEYDLTGNLKSRKDPKGNVTRFTYDTLGRLIKVTNPKNEEVSYQYDNLNNLIKILVLEYDNTGQLNRQIITQKEYDDLGRLIKTIDPLGKTEYYTYDKVGNLLQKIDKMGQKLVNTYDKRNRPLTQTCYKKDSSVESQKTFNYSQLYTQNKLTATDARGTTVYEYYPNSALKKETQPDNKYVTYEYDNNGNRSKLIDPYGLTITYTYDSRNRLDLLTINGSKTFDYDYYQDGMIKSLKYPNAIGNSTFTYDDINRLTSLSNAAGSGTNHYSYQYDGNSNIQSVTANGQTKLYQYDTLNRLEMAGTDQVTHYAYDARGNRTQLSGYVPEFYYNDLQGNNKHDFQYNVLNQLTQIKIDGTTILGTYKYNLDGLRAEKTTSQGTTKYYYDNMGRTLSEANSSSSVTAQVVWGHKPLARIINNQYYYYIYNGHGDVVQVINQNGVVVNSYEYDEWGNIIQKQEQINNPIRYAGEYYDDESGLYYLRARYYDPFIGRFITKDSYEGQLTNPMSMNQYVYCLNNPLIFIDKSGNEPISIILEYAPEALDSLQNLVSTYGPELAQGLQEAGNWIVQHGPQVVEGVKNTAKNVTEKLKDLVGSDGGGSSNLDPNKFDKGGSNSRLPDNRSIDSKVTKELKRMGLDKKFQNAMDKGLAPRREGTSGIIELTKNEMITKNGIEYTYKIKVPTAGGHTRVYGYINDAGELIFDLLMKK